MKFSLTVPFTRAEGTTHSAPSVPIKILRYDDRTVLYEGIAYIVTGTAVSFVNSRLNLGISPDGLTCSIVMDNGKETIEITETFGEAIHDTGHDVILGMSFLAHFRFVYAGLAQTTTLTYHDPEA